MLDCVNLARDISLTYRPRHFAFSRGLLHMRKELRQVDHDSELGGRIVINVAFQKRHARLAPATCHVMRDHEKARLLFTPGAAALSESLKSLTCPCQNRLHIGTRYDLEPGISKQIEDSRV